MTDDEHGGDEAADPKAAPPDMSQSMDPRPPIARAQAIFRTLDRNFQQLAEELQHVEQERAQLVWLLMLFLKRNGGRLTITKGEIADLDPVASFQSYETEIGYAYELIEGEDAHARADAGDAGGAGRH